ncbi:hypothetical protein AB0M34_10785 [Nocardia sp. NPDC050193]
MCPAFRGRAVTPAVFDASGRVMGALGVSAPAGRAEALQERAVEAVVREADAMTRRLGGTRTRSAALEA